LKAFLKDDYSEARGVPALKPILQSWIDVQRHYSKAVAGDCSWYYRERTCIGFLAASVWRVGGVALEEWATEKGVKAKRRQGRCDLWIFRHARYNFHVEAKHMWSRATGKDDRERTFIERELSRATSDARALTCPRKNQLGILFVAPFYPPGKHTGMAEHVAEWLEGIYSIPHSAIAWIFRDRRGLRPSRGNVGPGLVLIARTTK
jgi:hypothetical protein